MIVVVAFGIVVGIVVVAFGEVTQERKRVQMPSLVKVAPRKEMPSSTY